LRVYADRIGFGIGTAYQARENADPLFPPVFSKQFNTVMMKTFMERIEPMKDEWDWSFPDEAFGKAEANDQKIFGGPLVYNNPNAPAWLLFDRKDCGAWTADELEGIMRQYIQNVIDRYGKLVAGWEVVNEPVTNPETCWRRILGTGYITRAFQYAHAANPDARLMVNDGFGWEGVDKDATDRFFSFVKQLKNSGAPVDMVGIQMHLNAETLHPSYPEEFRYFLDQAREAGVEVQITEMDVYQGPPGHFPDPWEVQRRIYRTITQICVADANCTDLIVWGVSDRYTWLAKKYKNDFIDPQPLLFDNQFREKPAFFGVLEALRDASGVRGK
jgi:endo-1,4-beta-xylanase